MTKHRAIALGLFLSCLIVAGLTTRDAFLAVTVVEADTGDSTPVRVRLTDADGNPPVMLAGVYCERS